MSGEPMEVEVVRHFRAGTRDFVPGDRIAVSEAEAWRNYALLRDAGMIRLAAVKPVAEPAPEPDPEGGEARRTAKTTKGRAAA